MGSIPTGRVFSEGPRDDLWRRRARRRASAPPSASSREALESQEGAEEIREPWPTGPGTAGSSPAGVMSGCRSSSRQPPKFARSEVRNGSCVPQALAVDGSPGTTPAGLYMSMTLAGLEPAIFASEERRLIH